MARAVILVTNYDPAYLRIWEHLVRREVARGSRPLVLDATPVSAVPPDSYHRRALALFRLEYPGHDLRPRMEGLGAEVRVLEVTGDGDTALDTAAEDELAISVQSALISYFRTDRADRTVRRIGRTAAALAREGRLIYRAITDLLTTEQGIDVVYVPNGRAPNQKLASMAATRLGIGTLHIEKGETPHGVYLQAYAPQERVQSQQAATPVLAGLDHAEVERIAQTWLDRRRPSKDSRNEFAALWTADAGLSRISEGGKVVGFFTSSQDEFQFLGPEWQLHDWEDQFVAFDRLLVDFEAAGFSCYLRVHPNLATKAHECFVRERDGIRWLADRHPGLDIIWHDAPANTYALLAQTDEVVVWDSTVGLEASAMGIPVRTVATSRYGMVADVREILSAEQVDREGLVRWEVDAHGALRFIAYLVKRDEQMDPEFQSWIPWHGRSPLGARVAAALASGGSPYIRDAVASIVDVYRHRSFSANWVALRRRR